ncbi:hypothetical protein B23_1460 [Geobacillus thermoleovorans B23]|nr:hypothetical protein B23_1460 [Geobacillus thermoleovorans B23]
MMSFYRKIFGHQFQVFVQVLVSHHQNDIQNGNE